MSAAELWDRGQEGWPRAFPIAQFPNPPLLVAFAGWVLARAGGGDIYNAGRAIFALGLVVWAWQETTGGANWFRRLLGVAGLVWVAVQVAQEF